MLMTLGKRIQAARKRLGMTQSTLGEHFDITDKAVSAWERDETLPEMERLRELRKVLRVTFAWLMAGEGDPPDEGDPSVLWDDQLAAKWAAAAERNRQAPTPQKARRR